ncbi:hypothetical protein EDB89DRAFT_1559989 [Lactarius sanguifluus]|nr:hypothetical protein EDB89DRAFT_1559989 [Lactarius sanguifluus]
MYNGDQYNVRDGSVTRKWRNASIHATRVFDVRRARRSRSHNMTQKLHILAMYLEKVAHTEVCCERACFFGANYHWQRAVPSDYGRTPSHCNFQTFPPNSDTPALSIMSNLHSVVSAVDKYVEQTGINIYSPTRSRAETLPFFNYLSPAAHAFSGIILGEARPAELVGRQLSFRSLFFLLYCNGAWKIGQSVTLVRLAPRLICFCFSELHLQSEISHPIEWSHLSAWFDAFFSPLLSSEGTTGQSPCVPDVAWPRNLVIVVDNHRPEEAVLLRVATSPGQKTDPPARLPPCGTTSGRASASTCAGTNGDSVHSADTRGRTRALCEHDPPGPEVPPKKKRRFTNRSRVRTLRAGIQ